MNFIFVEEFVLDAFVGIYPREKVHAQKIQLDLELGLPAAAFVSDDISKTVNYAELLKLVRNLLQEQRFKLIETLAESVTKTLFDNFPVQSVRLRVAKVGIARGVKRVGVCIERQRATD